MDTKRSDFFIGISYVGGLEYTAKAIKSLGHYSSNVVILDCAETPTGLDYTRDEKIIRPEIPLSHTQCHNAFQRWAIARRQPFYFVMHNDAEASPEIIEQLVARAQTEQSKWAVMFTNYDSLACYSTEAAKTVGPWDWKQFQSYYSDDDFHYRCKLAGYEIIKTDLPVKHEGSHIINKVDRWVKYYTRLNFEHWSRMYVEKWNGHPGMERFTRPYDVDPAMGPFPLEDQ